MAVLRALIDRYGAEDGQKTAYGNCCGCCTTTGEPEVGRPRAPRLQTSAARGHRRFHLGGGGHTTLGRDAAWGWGLATESATGQPPSIGDSRGCGGGRRRATVCAPVPEIPAVWLISDFWEDQLVERGRQYLFLVFVGLIGSFGFSGCPPD
jgi:hypothetical protein